MSQYQTQMIPIDSKLNYLETALNVEKMKTVFQQQMYSDESTQIVTCDIERIKYKPQKNCHVSYRLSIRNNRLKTNSEQLVCSRFYEQGGAISRFLKESDNEVSNDLILYTPELDCVSWIFPYDRKLTHLKQLTDNDFLSEKVAPVLVSSCAGTHWSIRDFQAEVIRYVPEHTCSVCAKLQIKHNQSNEQSNIVAYGKTYYNEDGEQVYWLMRQLWDSDACRKDNLNIPEPLLYMPQYSMLWQKGVPGTMLSEITDKGALFLNSVANAARQIALLHQISLEECPLQGQEYILQELNKVEQKLNKFNVPRHEQIAQLIEKLRYLFPTVQSEQLTTLHGDLHLKNILVDNDRVYLIDLDNISKGNPLQDIGSFIAAIINLGSIKSLSIPLVEQTIYEFIQAYRNTVPWLVKISDLRWYIANALVSERVFRSVTRLKAGRMEIVGELVELAQLLLDESFTPYWLQVES